MTRLHTPVVEALVTRAVSRLPLHREHGGLGQNLPIGLEEGPPVFAGGSDVLQALDGWETVVSPSARVGGVVISNHSILSWIYQEDPDVDYEIRMIGNIGWAIDISIGVSFDNLVYLAIDGQGNLEDYMDG